MFIYYVPPLKVTSVRLPKDASTNRMRGFGYAELPSKEDLDHALSLDGEVGCVWCGCHGDDCSAAMLHSTRL